MRCPHSAQQNRPTRWLPGDDASTAVLAAPTPATGSAARAGASPALRGKTAMTLQDGRPWSTAEAPGIDSAQATSPTAVVSEGAARAAALPVRGVASLRGPSARVPPKRRTADIVEAAVAEPAEATAPAASVVSTTAAAAGSRGSPKSTPLTALVADGAATTAAPPVHGVRPGWGTASCPPLCRRPPGTTAAAVTPGAGTGTGPTKNTSPTASVATAAAPTFPAKTTPPTTAVGKGAGATEPAYTTPPTAAAAVVLPPSAAAVAPPPARGIPGTSGSGATPAAAAGTKVRERRTTP